MHRYSKKTQVIKSHFIFRFSFLVVKTGKNITMACLGKSIIISKYLQNFEHLSKHFVSTSKKRNDTMKFYRRKKPFLKFLTFFEILQKYSKNSENIQNGSKRYRNSTKAWQFPSLGREILFFVPYRRSNDLEILQVLNNFNLIAQKQGFFLSQYYH